MQGQLIGNRYLLQDLIGEGGMASVYSATDEKLGRKIAIKILHSHLSKNEDIRKRFHLEARSISGIDHPNIIKVFDFSGVESEQLWIVTEILYGVDLGDYVERFPKNRLHPIVACLIAREICKALVEAHDHGIIHRDIKPENIMVLDSGRIKLMDFGIAKVSENPNATQTGIFMGSPSYMSKEQIRGIKIDTRTDIYSLCVLFYEILTGILPFAGNTTPDVINKIMVGKFSPPIALNPNLPKEVNDIVLKGLHSDRTERFSSVNELATKIDEFLIRWHISESSQALEQFFQSPRDFEQKLNSFDKSQRQPFIKITASEESTKIRTSSSTVLKTNDNPETAKIAATPQKKIAKPPLPAPSNKANQPRKVQLSSRAVQRPSLRASKKMRHHKRQASISTNQSKRAFWNFMLFVSSTLAITVFGLIIIDARPELKNLINKEKPLELTQASEPQAVEATLDTSQTEASEEQASVPASSDKIEITEKKAKTTKSPVSSYSPPEPIRRKAPFRRPNTSPAKLAVISKEEEVAPIATVYVRSNPSAEIIIANKSYGRSNSRKSMQQGIQLTPGRYKLTLKRQGYLDKEQWIELTNGQSLRISENLISETIPFYVQTNRIPSLLYIDQISPAKKKNQWTMTETSMSLQLEPGSYRIEIVYSGQKIERVINIVNSSDPMTFNANFN